MLFCHSSKLDAGALLCVRLVYSAGLYQQAVHTRQTTSKKDPALMSLMRFMYAVDPTLMLLRSLPKLRKAAMTLLSLPSNVYDSELT